MKQCLSHLHCVRLNASLSVQRCKSNRLGSPTIDRVASVVHAESAVVS